MRQQAVNFGTRFISEDVKRIDFTGRPFRLFASDDQSYEAKSVIVATGAGELSRPAVGGEVQKPRRERLRRLRRRLARFRNKPMAVIGGGDSAVEEATYLTKFASKVHLVHRRDKLRASKIMAERALSNPKIDFLWNRSVDEVLGSDHDGVTGMRLKSTVGEADLETPISGFFLGIGHTPNTAFLDGRWS